MTNGFDCAEMGRSSAAPLRGKTQEPAGMPALQRQEKCGTQDGGVKPPLNGKFGLCGLRMGLDGLDQVGQDGDGDGNVARGDKNGEEFGEALQPGSVNGMAEAERLEHAPEAVIEVIAKHDHGNDVEKRDGPDLEAGDDVVVDIVLVERPAGVNRPEGKMQEVEDYKSGDDWPAPQHGAGSVSRVEIGLLDVTDGPGFALKKPELEGRPNVQADGEEQRDASAPQEGGDGPEKRGVIINFLGWKVDLEVADQVADHKAEEDEAGDGHDGFLADGGLPEAQAAGGKICSGS